MTTPPQAAAPKPAPEPKQAAAPPPPPQSPPEPPRAAPGPERAAEPPPPVAAPAEKPKPKPEPPKAKAEPQPVPETRLANAEPTRKPKPPAPSRDFSSVLKDLAAEPTNAKPAPKAQVATAPEQSGAVREPAPRARDIATITEIDALRVSIRRQIEPCWSPPIGAREADELTVKIVVYVEPTGRVRRAEIVDAGRMALDQTFQAAADSARRAVLNDRCNPLKDLPADRYELWRELELTFNPKDALG
jgi:outer membrane biosynthesis protein TonB